MKKNATTKKHLILLLLTVPLLLFYLAANSHAETTNNQKQQQSSLSKEDMMLLQSYLNILKDIKNLYNEIKMSENNKVETNRNTDKKIVREENNKAEALETKNTKTQTETTVQVTQKLADVTPNITIEEPKLVTQKYSVGLIYPIFEKDLKNLFDSSEAKAVVFEDFTVEITDTPLGHKKIAEYIERTKSKFARIYNYEISINDNQIYTGTVSPILPATFGQAGTIECLPRDEFLIVQITEHINNLNLKFMLSINGGEYYAQNDKNKIKIIIK